MDNRMGYSTEQIWELLQKKVAAMAQVMGERSPNRGIDGVYNDDPLYKSWVSGFWPGMLWIMYEMTGREEFKSKAWDWDEKIEQYFIKENLFNHDVGFQFLPTAVIKYKITGDREGRRRGLNAANFLAGRYNPAGQFIRAWDNAERTGWSIIDTSMNLSILFWATRETKDPRFGHIAKIHADTVLRHFIREDGSARHIVHFDEETGAYVEALGGQGYGPDSAWSRGQAWALYGMANTYGYTGDMKYLWAAQRIANHFIAALPEDSVPYWDFRLPSLEGEPRDTSAAACAASGMLEIAAALSPEEGGMYKRWAKRILHSLAQNYASFDEPEYEPILRGATGNRPKNVAVNVSLIYGDYFFVEGVAKLSGWKSRIF